MAYKSMMSDLIRQAVRKSGVDKATGGHASIDEREEKEERFGGSRGRPSKVKRSARARQQEARAGQQATQQEAAKTERKKAGPIKREKPVLKRGLKKATGGGKKLPAKSKSPPAKKVRAKLSKSTKGGKQAPLNLLPPKGPPGKK